MQVLSAQPDEEDGMSEVTVVLTMKQREWLRLSALLSGPAPVASYAGAVAEFSKHVRRALWGGTGVTLH